jgi:hypothetical protein
MGACPGETAYYGRIGHRSAKWKQEFIGKRVTDEDHEEGRRKRTMKCVEQHVIEKTHPQFPALDEMALASKNLWNLANYQVRQSFVFEHTYLDTTTIFHRIKHTDA